MKLLTCASLVVLLTISACNGTETQNPSKPDTTLLSFGNSGCKKETLAHAVRSTQAVTDADGGVISYAEEVAGLKCFAWQPMGTGSIKISLINFEEACGAQWQGKAELDSSGALTLGLVNPQCLIASCGYCIYDWSFEVNGIPAGENLPVTVNIDTCPGEQPIKVTSAELPLARQSEGILCRYANHNALGWQAASLGTCGEVGMPCTGTSMCSLGGDAAEQTCQTSLTCTDNGNPSEMICAQPCTVDSDCGITGVQSCQAGLCRPKAAW